MPAQSNIALGIYKNRIGTKRTVLILEKSDSDLTVIWQDPETGNCYRCTRRSFLRWIRSYRRPVVDRAPRRSIVAAHVLARYVVDFARAVREAEKADFRRKLDSEFACE